MDTRLIRNAALAIFVVLFGMGLVNATSCQTWASPNAKIIGVTWGNSSHYISAAPGNKDVPLTVTLETYDTNCVFQNVVGSLELYGGITDYTGASTSTYYMQSTQPPSIINMVFYLNIADNVTMGPNVSATYPLVLEWDSDNGSVNVKQQMNVQVPLQGAANLSFEVQKPDITAGKITNVSIVVSNTGSGIASNIGAAVSSAQGVSFLSQPNEISSLAPGQSKNMTLTLYVAPSQSGNSQAGASVILNLATYYISPYGHNTTTEHQIGLFATSPSQSSVIVSVRNQTLISGIIKEMNLTVSNTGSDPVTNLSVVLTPQSPLSIIGPDNLNPVGIVPPGGSVNLPIKLYAQSSTSAVSTLGISLSYILDNQQETISRSISFLNPGNINTTTVSTVVSPSSPRTGQIFSITSTLDNIGAQSATAAQVTPNPPEGINILGSPTTFIGSIPVDTPTAFTVSFTVSPNAKPGTYTIPVVLSYLNNLNQRENRTLNYTIEVGSGILAGNATVATGPSGARVVTSRKTSGGSSHPVVIALVIIVIAIVGYYLYRRRARRKHETKAHGR